MISIRRHSAWFPLMIALLPLGCSQMIVSRTDRDVYRLIENRQQLALGETSDAGATDDPGHETASNRMYDFHPRPIPPDIPPEFDLSAEDGDPAPVEERDFKAGESYQTLTAGTAQLSPKIFTEEEQTHVTVFGVSASLQYASRRGRSLQDAKEELYLAALDLSLERHLWTPQWVASVQADVDYADDGEPVIEESAGTSSSDGSFLSSTESSLSTRSVGKDRAFQFISDVAVAQRLPYGGELTAKIVTNLVRDLTEHVARGESGSLILEADIPLLRGAGRTAYESRYAAERELIYAVRTYERFRRSFLVEVASGYFNLQSLRTAIDNTHQSYQGRRQDWERADFVSRMGRNRTIFDAPRAKSTLRAAEAALVSAKEQYQSALDRFKVFIGMPVGELLDVIDQEADEESKALDASLPDVERAVAEDVAMRYRLDLLSSADAVDDTRRGRVNARNAILPDLALNASWATHSDPDHLNAFTFNSERMTWHAGLLLTMDDRKTERNAFLASLISVRRAQRDHEQFIDEVRADVRRALRRVGEQENLWKIQTLNVEENEFRLAAAKAQFELGRSTNQDVVDADNDLLTARNQLARAVAGYRVAILELRRDSGTLRIRPDGTWRAPNAWETKKTTIKAAMDPDTL